jgi:hypothetical protein
MPLTIAPIPNATPFASFTEDTNIFSNSKAKDVPVKLTAITDALKTHVNDLWLLTATGFVNDTVVANLNTVLSDIETLINTQLTEFETNLGNYLGVGAGYSVDVANAALFTGAAVASTTAYDDIGRIVSVEQGARLINAITYNDDNTMAGYTEALTLGGITYTRSFTFSYMPDGQINAISEV